MKCRLYAPEHLRCETFANPLGLGEPQPTLSWTCRSDRWDQKTSAYQVLVGDCPEALGRDQGNIWDSGKVGTAGVNEIVYGGPALTSRLRCFWKIRVWDSTGAPSAWSAPAYWEMGLLAATDWTAAWIGSPVIGGPRTVPPCPYLRKAFALDQGIRRARLHVTALGLYECEINGQRVGRREFAPGWTDYARRVQVQTYDVTPLLRPGENVLGAILGDGWYCGHTGWEHRQACGDRPQLCAQLEIEIDGGVLVTVASDGSWQTTTGPILESDILMGESYDARRELGTWSSPGYDATWWGPVLMFGAPDIERHLSASAPVRHQEELRPTGAPKAAGAAWGPKILIYDLGQNITGRARIALRGPAGTTVRLRFAEVLDADGNLYTENLRTARATDYYTLKGGDLETWEPRFTFHGFRYVEVSWRGADVQVDDLRGIVLHSDIAPTGVFRCSHPLLNQLQDNIQWGQKGNFLDVPTDCPQRDERLGWTGDAQVFIRTACFNRDVRGFFHKWLLDGRDAQGPEGNIPPTFPGKQLPEADGGPAWADAIIICPWTIYLCYGDRRILERNYDAMRRFVDYLLQQRVKDFIRSHPEIDAWGGFGDWLALDGSSNWQGNTPKDLIGTAYLAYDLELMAQIADALGEAADANHYRDLHGKVVAAFRRRFVTAEGLVAGATQTAYVLALKFGLLPEESRAEAINALVRDIERRDWHLSTGFVGASYLCPALAEHGRLDVAYKLLERETFPSWLFPVLNGATTIWERWNGWTPENGFADKGMNSFNHYAYGAIGAWMVAGVAGLDLDPAEPGYRHIVFRPSPGGSLTWAEARLETPLGMAAIRWETGLGQIRIDVEVPVNARASLHLPAGYDCRVEERGTRIEPALRAGVKVVQFGSGVRQFCAHSE